MSENIQPKQNQSDEVDLTQLFRMIGNGFNRFFKFIGSIFKAIFNTIIALLIFIQKNIIKFTIAGALGIGLGIYLDLTKETEYVSTMVVEPNFNSVQQLYNNVNFYNELAEAEDSISLAKALNISPSDAANLKNITVQSFSDENQKIKLFDEFVRELDSTTRSTIDFKSYIKNFNTLDARFHQIKVVSTNSMIAKKIQQTIINSIANNEYFKVQKQINDENLYLQDTIYRKQLREIDSLQKLYKQVMLETAKNPNLGTNINMADKESSQNKELELIKQIDVLKKNLVVLNQERANKSNILNVISDFPDQGVELKGLFNKYIFWCFVGALAFLLLVLSLLELNKYLKNYSKEKGF